MKFNKEQIFTETWFDSMIPLWEGLAEQIKSNDYKIKNVLEVGCYEGRATSFICEKILEDEGNVTVVDTFGGSTIETGMIGTDERKRDNENFIYENFIHNISFYPQINFSVKKGFSNIVLPKLLLENKSYDLIYIDASHKSDDTFVDAYYCGKMLNLNGLMIFDDFGWKDPNKEHSVYSPEAGIRFFEMMYNENYSLVYSGYQAIFQKTS